MVLFDHGLMMQKILARKPHGNKEVGDPHVNKKVGDVIDIIPETSDMNRHR